MKTTTQHSAFDLQGIDIGANETCPIARFFASERERLAEQWHAIVARVNTCELSHETLHTVESGNLDALKKELMDYERSLRSHIRLEEQFLFFIEQTTRTPKDADLTALQRSEHQQIGSLDRIERALDAHTCAAIIQTVEGLAENLSDLMRKHDEEESALYLRVDRGLSVQQVRELLSAWQNTPLTGD
jgi:hemerythrin-like domain-containing protein